MIIFIIISQIIARLMAETFRSDRLTFVITCLLLAVSVRVCLKLVPVTLSGGDETMGRLDVYVDGHWGTVCKTGFTSSAAVVACRQLGMVGGKVLLLSMNPVIEPKRNVIAFKNVTCEGNEPHLLSCSLSRDTLGSSHQDDVGVQCDTNRNVVIGASLSGGHEVSQGQLQVFVKGKWGSVCNNRWDSTNGKVACNQLGYAGYLNYHSIVQANSSVPVLMSDLDCTGDESSLLQCHYKSLDSPGDQCSSGYVEIWCTADTSLVWFEALLPHEMFSKQVFLVSGLDTFEFEVKVCSGLKLVLMGIEMMSVPYLEIRISEFVQPNYYVSSIWECMKEDDQCSKLNSSSAAQSLLSCDNWRRIWIAVDDTLDAVHVGLGQYNTSRQAVFSWMSQKPLDWIMYLKVGALYHEFVYRVYRGKSYTDSSKYIQNACLYTLDETKMKNSMVPCGVGYIDSSTCNQCGCCFSAELTPQCFHPKEWSCVIELRSYSGVNTEGGYIKLNGRIFFPSPVQRFSGIAIGLIVPDSIAGCRLYDIKEFDGSLNMEIALSAYIVGIPAGIEYVIITGNLPVQRLENSLMLLIKEGFEISDIGANGLFAGYSIKGLPKKTQLVKSSKQTYVNISITIKDMAHNDSCVKTFDEAVGKILLISSGDSTERELVTFVLLVKNLFRNMKAEVDFDDNSKALLSPEKSSKLPKWAANSTALFGLKPFFSATFNHSYAITGRYEVQVKILDAKITVNSPSVTARTTVKIHPQLPFKDVVGIVRIHTNKDEIVGDEEFVVSVFVEHLTDGLAVTVDFGDDTRVENLKATKQNVSLGSFIDPEKAVTYLTNVSHFFWTKAGHKYKAVAARSYLVSVMVADPSWVSEPIRLTTNVMVTCEEVKIDIVGGSRNSSSIPEYVRYMPVTFTGSYAGWCEEDRGNIQKEWTAYKLTSEVEKPTDTNRVSIPWDALSSSGLELNIPSFAFDYGLYFLEFKVLFPVKQTSGDMFKTAHTWFKVVEKIQEMASARLQDDSVAGSNSVVHIKPSVNNSGEGDLSYKWYCTRGTDVLDKDLKTGGCFGRGTEIPLGNVSSFSVNVTTLIRDYKTENYKFYLYVLRHDEVVSIGTQELKVVADEAPKFFVNCISNCGFRININKDIEVSATCSNCANQMVSYQWDVIPRTALQFVELIGSDQEVARIRFRPNAMSMLGNYSANSSDPVEAMLAKYSKIQNEYYLNVIGTIESGLQGSASLTIRLQDYLEESILKGTRTLLFSVQTLVLSLMFVIIIT